MRGRRATPAQERQFWALVAGGLNPGRAAVQVGLSRQWGWRKHRGVEPSRTLAEQERLDETQPNPKTWAELDGGAREALRDFAVFGEMFLLRRPVPWRRDAAMRVVDALQDRTTRSYMVLNMPPGSGKSTLFTHDIPAWLIAGGGLSDPLRGRAVRVMLGSFGYRLATHPDRQVQLVTNASRQLFVNFWAPERRSGRPRSNEETL